MIEKMSQSNGGHSLLPQYQFGVLVLTLFPYLMMPRQHFFGGELRTLEL
jgi:hypothetical protein